MENLDLDGAHGRVAMVGYDQVRLVSVAGWALQQCHYEGGSDVEVVVVVIGELLLVMGWWLLGCHQVVVVSGRAQIWVQEWQDQKRLKEII